MSIRKSLEPFQCRLFSIPVRSYHSWLMPFTLILTLFIVRTPYSYSSSSADPSIFLFAALLSSIAYPSPSPQATAPISKQKYLEEVKLSIRRSCICVTSCDTRIHQRSVGGGLTRILFLFLAKDAKHSFANLFWFSLVPNQPL